MSFERAYVSCGNCYKIAGDMTGQNDNAANRTELYRSRDNALAALEHAATGGVIDRFSRGTRYQAHAEDLSQKLREDCMRCTHLAPMIRDGLSRGIGFP